jgi:ABC-type transport system involved in multi-copper enzyme maturation permease subunit
VPRNALVGKELRTRMRTWKSTVVIIGYMTVLGLIAMAFLIQQQGPVSNQSSQVGVQLFEALAIFQLFLILFITPATTAGAISGERQRQTWDLLRVTRLSSFGIVWGKLVTGLAFGILLLFASLPLFSLVFLFGGVAPEDIVHTYLVFLATIVLVGTVSLFISAATRRLAVSMIVSNVMALLLGVGLSLLAVYLQSTQQAQPYYGGGPPPFGPNGPRSPALTPLAQIDPLIALLSALPTGNGDSVLSSDLSTIHHAFGFPLTVPLWEAFTVLTVGVTVLLLIASTLLVRRAPGWLSSEGG